MLSCAVRMTGGPCSTGTVVPEPLGLVVSPGCPLIVTGAPVDVPPDWAAPAPARSWAGPAAVLAAPPPPAAAATRVAVVTGAFFIRRPPRRNSELSDPTPDRAARNIRPRAPALRGRGGALPARRRLLVRVGCPANRHRPGAACRPGRPSGQRPVGRRGPPGRAGPRVVRRSGPAPARRADQPPRQRRQDLA